jgi:hypothetical protein
MSDRDPLAGIIPRAVHPVNDGEATIPKYIEKIDGEVELDAYVRAQMSAPEVVKRITELENCVWRLADAILALEDIDRHRELRAAAEEARLVLKNQLKSMTPSIGFTANWKCLRTIYELSRIN